MSDESIDHLVKMCEAAELMGKSLGMSTPKAMRAMLKSLQVMARMNSDTAQLEAMVPGTRTKQ
jgi:proteasome assembly chaperone (PAC2) family protein